MEVPICQICKDPIWSFVCIDCLADGIRDWLPQGLRSDFFEFNTDFRRFFSNNTDVVFLSCLHCRDSKEASICPFCYLTEVIQWLKIKDAKKAEQLMKMIPTERDWKLTETNGCVWKDGFLPITESCVERTHEGICENCGEYSDDILFVDGRWLCRNCKDE